MGLDAAAYTRNNRRTPGWPYGCRAAPLHLEHSPFPSPSAPPPHSVPVLGAARCPRLMYLLDQQRAGLDATDGCVDRERGRSVDPITCTVHIDLAVYETEYTQSKAAAAARRRRPATSLSQRCPSTRKGSSILLTSPGSTLTSSGSALTSAYFDFFDTITLQ